MVDQASDRGNEAVLGISYHSVHHVSHEDVFLRMTTGRCAKDLVDQVNDGIRLLQQQYIIHYGFWQHANGWW